MPLPTTDGYFNRIASARLDGLLGSMAGGSRAALGELYAAVRAPVYAYALSVLKNAQDAEDVLHDCLLSAWNAAESYRSEGKPMAWIMTIARNLCLLRLRERRKTAEVPPEDWEPYLAGRAGLSPEDRQLIAQCMTRLTDEERQIVMLHAVAGFRHREIAEALELPLPTVLSKYRRALKKLKEHITGGELSYETRCD